MGKKRRQVLENSKYSFYNFILNKNVNLFIILTLISIILYQSLYYESSRDKNSWPTKSDLLIRPYAHLVAFPTLSHHETSIKDLTLFDDFTISYNQSKTSESARKEAEMAVHLALIMQSDGKYDKAAKIFEYALKIDPKNTNILNSYGEFIEKHRQDVLKAEHYYMKALSVKSDNSQAILNRARTLPLVENIDREMLNKINKLLKQFYEISVSNPALKRAKREAYFMHIYHSNAIEGNTLNLQQTRHIVETRMAINGKSLLEHQEVLGLDAAMRFINETLLYKPLGELTISDILDIHKRVLGYADPIESGRFREHQVYVGSFMPPRPSEVYKLMREFIEWLNSYQTLNEIHPIQLAALAHYKLAYIHPFYDGNGRTSRLLMNLILMREGYPPVIIRKQDRMSYYDYLEMANQGDIKPFIRFIARCAERTLNEYILICNSSHSISADNLDTEGEFLFNDGLEEISVEN